MGAVKRGILATNGFRILGYDRHAKLANLDRFAAIKDDYLRYGYVRRT
jgi:hypothetical protein